jgi:hypothetical protein
MDKSPGPVRTQYAVSSDSPPHLQGAWTVVERGGQEALGLEMPVLRGYTVDSERLLKGGFKEQSL